MLSENQKEFAACKITDYHQGGFKGQGIKIAVLDESPQLKACMVASGKFKTPLGCNDYDASSHATSVAQVVHEVAPEAEIIMLPYIRFSGVCGNLTMADTLRWLQNNSVDLINISASIVCNEADSDMQALKALGIPIVCASGNNGNEDKINNPAAFAWTIAVGAWLESLDQQASYSNGGAELDCVGYSSIAIPTDSGGYYEFTGTSCAAPFISGMLALYMGRFGKLGLNEVRELIKNNCRDVDTKGFDYNSGYGLFVLPDKAEVGKMIKIKMRIGSTKYTVNGEIKTMDEAPELSKNGVTKVPLRAVAEAFGALVEWDGKSQEINITLE